MSTIKKNTLIFFFALIGTIGMSAAYSKDSEFVFVPLDVSRAGQSASIDVHVSWFNQKYPRFVNLMISPPESGWGDLIIKRNELMASITGLRPDFDTGSNAIPKPHHGIPLHVVWKVKDTGRILQKEDVVADSYLQPVAERIRAGYGYPLFLSDIDLQAGDYVVTVTTLKDDPRFDGTFRTGIVAGYSSY